MLKVFAMIRKIELLVDDDDFREIQLEFTMRQKMRRELPDAERGSSISGRMVGEIVRDLTEYRSLWIAEHTRRGWIVMSIDHAQRQARQTSSSHR